MSYYNWLNLYGSNIAKFASENKKQAKIISSVEMVKDIYINLE